MYGEVEAYPGVSTSPLQLLTRRRGIMGEDKPVEKKKKATRSAKPVYAIMSVQDNTGTTMDIAKENVTIHRVEKNAEEVLEALDAGTLPNGSFYKRIALS